MKNDKKKSPKTERVKKVIRWLIGEGIGESQEEIGVLLGYSNKSAFSQVVNNESKMPGDLSSRLCSLSNKLVESWVDSGEGDMLKTYTPPEISSPAKEERGDTALEIIKKLLDEREAEQKKYEKERRDWRETAKRLEERISALEKEQEDTEAAIPDKDVHSPRAR